MGRLTERINLNKLVKRRYHTRETLDRGPSEAVKKAGEYDIWAQPNESSEEEDADGFLRPMKKRKVKEPPTLKSKPPIAVPAVTEPPPGASYNPTFTDHQALLREAHEEEYRKVESIEKLKSKLPAFTEASSSELDFGTGAKTKNALKRKTKSMRNRIKRRLEQERLEAEKKVQKRINNDLARITNIAKQVKSEVAKHEKKLQEKAKLIEENTKRPPKKIGKYRVPKLPIDVQLSEDLSESLRTLKPEGNLFVDRMTSLQQRSIIEPRVPTKARRKRRRKATHDD